MGHMRHEPLQAPLCGMQVSEESKYRITCPE